MVSLLGPKRGQSCNPGDRTWDPAIGWGVQIEQKSWLGLDARIVAPTSQASFAPPKTGGGGVAGGSKSKTSLEDEFDDFTRGETPSNSTLSGMLREQPQPGEGGGGHMLLTPALDLTTLFFKVIFLRAPLVPVDHGEPLAHRPVPLASNCWPEAPWRVGGGGGLRPRTSRAGPPWAAVSS